MVTFYEKNGDKYVIVPHKPNTEQLYVDLPQGSPEYTRLTQYTGFVTNIVGNTITYNEPAVSALEAKIAQTKYEAQVSQYIRQRYSVNAEIAIIRQRDDKPTEYQAYYDYCEECKARAKEDLKI